MVPAMSLFTANADYTETDRNPLFLNPGDKLTGGNADQAWPGWVWVTDRGGRSGYVPSEILEPVDGNGFIATAPFDPTVLVLRRGDRLESLRQIHGWHWCQNDRGEEGWVAGYLLRPLDPAP